MIIRKFETQVSSRPDKIAIETAGEYITYGQLNESANRLARLIAPGGVQNQGTAGLLVDHGQQQVTALLAVLKAGMIYVPLDGNYPGQRLEKIIRDSGIGLLIVSRANQELAQRLVSAVSADMNIRILAVEQAADPALSAAPPGRDAGIPGDHPAYILYTSGSTGQSKGVVQTRENICFYAQSYIRLLSITPQDRLSYISNFTHDGAIPDIYGSLLSGATLCAMDLRRQLGITSLGEWLQNQRITIYHSVPTVFRYLAASLDKTIKTPHLRYIMTGGEKLQTNDIRLAKKYFPGVLIGDIYGQTESTINAIGFIDTSQKLERITLGEPLSGVRLLVLNQSGEETEPYEVGEIFVACQHIAPGYWRKPRETAAAFLHDGELGRVYRTGDLGKLVVDGRIEYAGRKDHQVKIRGFRVELQEIEGLLSAHESVKEAAAALKKNRSGEDYLCAYLVPSAAGSGDRREGPGAAELQPYLAKFLPDYMIPAHFQVIDAFPRTATGKIDRQSLPEPELDDEIHTPPRDALEHRLVKIWAEVLNIPAQTIGIDSNFFSLGGHSLKATMMVSKIRKEFSAVLPLAAIFKTPFIRAIARTLREAKPGLSSDLEKTEEKEYYPLSYNQYRMYILHQLNPASAAYNMPKRFMLNARLDENTVKKVLNRLVRRHPSLRTGFRTVHNEPVQWVAHSIEPPLEVLDISKLEEGEKQQRREEVFYNLTAVPFDLETLPLFRTVLVKLGPDLSEFMFSIHHIVSDGWSLELLKKEFLQLYQSFSQDREANLEPLPFSYQDFSQWHLRRLETIDGERSPAARYWKRKLAGGIPVLQLPADFTGGEDSPAGAGYRCFIGEELKNHLHRLAERYHTSLFTVMFAIYMMLLARISGREYIACSIITAGRDHISLRNLVGLFVNAIFFKTRIPGDEPFDNFIRRINDDIMESLQYQAYPMEPVLEALNIRYPEVPLSFNMLNMQDIGPGQRLGAAQALHLKEYRDVKFDLEPYISEYEDGISLFWVYRKNRFEPATIEYIANLYIRLLEFFNLDTSRSLKDHIEEEKKQKKRRFARR
jgi:amino acid adenylation domain-containing protein